MMLVVSNISSGYGKVTVLRGVSIRAQPGEIHCILGRNGAGKTTIMKSIMGLLPLSSGTIHLDGIDIGRLAAHRIPKCGLGYVPQGRRLFAEMTVAENLEIGLRVRKKGRAALDRALEYFPRLRERMSQVSGTLSGGEQQMLATARALCLEPQLLLLDEPTEGLQPGMVEQIRQVIGRLKESGVAILLIEQRIDAILRIADRVSFVENGRSMGTVEAAELERDPAPIERYLGVRH